MCDLRSEYGIDLDNFFKGNGKLPLLKLLAYMKELPKESRLFRHIAGDSAKFDQKDHLLADIMELLRRIEWQNYYIIAANKYDPRKMKKAPKRIPRPGDPKPEFVSGKQLQQKLGGGLSGNRGRS